jgi:hypothetical protein
MSYCTKESMNLNKKFIFELNVFLGNGKDKVMFLTKDDLSSPSLIKQKEDEGFDPWEQHGLFVFFF